MQVKIKAVKGAYIEADNVAAAPTKAKLSGISSILNCALQNLAKNNPRIAPATMLGAKTPPSPPAPNVKEAATGFKNKRKANTNNGIVGELMISFNP